MSARREHFRAWWLEVLREGFERGQSLRGAPIASVLQYLGAAFAFDLKEDAKAIAQEIGLQMMATGARVARSGAERAIGQTFDALEDWLAGGKKRA